jgi:hypothetical protein
LPTPPEDIQPVNKLAMGSPRSNRDMTQDKLLEIYFNKLNARPTLGLVARHEAAHATMYYLVGLPSTRLVARGNHGLCVGAGKPADARQHILALLAGIAYEIKYASCLINLRNSKTADLAQARALLADNLASRRVKIDRKIRTVSVERALTLSMERTCDLLQPFHDTIESLGAELENAGELSAQRTGAFLRAHIGPDRKLEARQWNSPLVVTPEG